MTEQTTAPAESQTAPEELSLDDIYKEAGISEVQPQPQVAEPQAQVQAQPQATPPQTPDIPDPFDDRFKEHQRALLEKVTTLETTLQETARKESERERAIAAVKLEEDINAATAFVKENAGLDSLPYDDKTKLALANFELNERARTDPKFKMLWDARNNSPAAKAALDKAMLVVSKEIAKKFEARPDPSLVASKRALKAAQASSATTETPDVDDSAAPTDPHAFDRWWSQQARTNN